MRDAVCVAGPPLSPVGAVLQQTLDDILQAVMDDPDPAAAAAAAGAGGQQQQLCPEAAEILLELVKVIMTLVGEGGFLPGYSPSQTVMKKKSDKIQSLVNPVTCCFCLPDKKKRRK